MKNIPHFREKTLTAGIQLAALSLLPSILSAQRTTALGFAGGIEFHSEWTSSSYGPTAAVSMGRDVSGRLQIQGVVALSGRGTQMGEDVTAAPFDTARAPIAAPTRATLFAVEALLFDHATSNGGYVIAGLGAVDFGGGLQTTRRFRGQGTAGLGGAIRLSAASLFVELRFTRVFGQSPVARWLVPVRAGVRLRL